MQPTYPTVSTDGSTPITFWPEANTLPYYFPNIKTGVGQSENKARPKRKPRPKKSARSPKK